MNTFQEYQAIATKVPLSLRNNRDRIDLPIRGLQEESGKIGALLAVAFASGKLSLTRDQGEEIKERLADLLWYAALLCEETGIDMQQVVEHSVAQLHVRVKEIDPDRR